MNQKYSMADPFRQHNFKTAQISLSQIPKPQVFIAPEAYADMLAIASMSGTDEIGWLGTVTELGKARYLINNVYLPGQAVHGATCELSEDGLSELFTELAQSEEGLNLCSQMKFWGHIHPTNNTSPSQQDEDQMGQFDHNNWFIRGIFGRSGRAEFTFFDFRQGFRWNDVPWAIYCPVDKERMTHWAAQIEARVEKIIITPQPPFQFGKNQKRRTYVY